MGVSQKNMFLVFFEFFFPGQKIAPGANCFKGKKFANQRIFPNAPNTPIFQKYFLGLFVFFHSKTPFLKLGEKNFLEFFGKKVPNNWHFCQPNAPIHPNIKKSFCVFELFFWPKNFSRGGPILKIGQKFPRTFFPKTTQYPQY